MQVEYIIHVHERSSYKKGLTLVQVNKLYKFMLSFNQINNFMTMHIINLYVYAYRVQMHIRPRVYIHTHRDVYMEI